MLFGGLETPLCFVRCVVMPDLVDSAVNHILPLPVLIPDAVPNDTETGGSSRRAEKGREGRGKVAEKLL